MNSDNFLTILSALKQYLQCKQQIIEFDEDIDSLQFLYGYWTIPIQTFNDTRKNDQYVYELLLFENKKLYQDWLRIFQIIQNEGIPTNFMKMICTDNITTVPPFSTVGEVTYGWMIVQEPHYFPSDQYVQNLFENLRNEDLMKAPIFQYLADFNYLHHHNIVLRHALPLKYIFYQDPVTLLPRASISLKSAVIVSSIDSDQELTIMWKRWNLEHAGLVIVRVVGNTEFLDYFLPSDDIVPRSLYSKRVGSLLLPTISDVRSYLMSLEQSNLFSTEFIEFCLELNPLNYDLTMTLDNLLNHPWLQSSNKHILHQSNVMYVNQSRERELGVKLKSLQSFSRNCIHQGLRNATTTEIFEKVVRPATSSMQSSYCDYLLNVEPSAVGPAKVYISHAWKYKFTDVVEALVNQFQSEDEDLDVPIWFDLFSYNYCTIHDQSLDWLESIKMKIGEIGRTVLVVAPWNDPIPFKRAWCLYEIYCTIDQNCTFEVAMSKESEREFIRDFDSQVNEAIHKMFASIDCSKSFCTFEEDQHAIHEMINNTIGFTVLNSKVFDKMRELVITKYAKEFQRRKVQRGIKDAETLVAMNNLAWLYKDQGLFHQSEPLYVECLEGRRAVFGSNHLDTLITMNDIAALYKSQGRYILAEQLYLEGLDIARTSFGNDHEITLTYSNNLALLYTVQGKYEIAEPLLIECFEKSKVAQEPSQEILTNINNLASLYMNQGKYEEAEELYDRYLEKMEAVFGRNHPETLISINNIAEMYKRKGQYNLAEPLYLECLEKRKVLLGKNHPETLISMNNLAGLYKFQGKYELSEPIYVECVELSKAIMGPNHRDTLTAISNLAGLYRSQRKFELAESLYLESLEKISALLGPNHPDTLSCMNNLAELYEYQKKFDLAEPLFLDCLQKIRTTLGGNHPNTLGCMNNLAGLYQSEGKYELAEPLYQECCQQLLNLLGEYHPNTLSCHNNLAKLYQKQGRYDLAEPLYSDCLRKMKTVLGLKHPNTVATMNSLAALYCDQEKYEFVVPLYRSSLHQLMKNQNITDIQYLHVLLKLFPELGFYSELIDASPELLRVQPNRKLVEVLFGSLIANQIAASNVLEMNKFFIRLIYVRDFLRGKKERFLHLSQENFDSFCSFLLSTIETDSQLQFFLLSLIWDDLGRTRPFQQMVNQYEHRREEYRIDHDECLKLFLQYYRQPNNMNTFYQYLPSFKLLSFEDQRLYLNKISNTFNLGAFVQGESVPYSLYQFYLSCPTAIERKSRLLVQMLSFAAVNPSMDDDFQSRMLNDVRYSQFMLAIEMIMKEHPQSLTPNYSCEVYDTYLRQRVLALQLPENIFAHSDGLPNAEEKALYRIMALARITNRKEYEQVWYVWNKLSRRIRLILIEFLTRTGFTLKTAIYIYYAPAILANTIQAFQNDPLSLHASLQGKEPFVQGLFYGLQELVKIYQQTDEELENNQLIPQGKVENEGRGGIYISSARDIAERMKNFTTILKLPNGGNPAMNQREEYEIFE